MRRDDVQPAVLLSQGDIQETRRLLHGARVRVLRLGGRVLARRRVSGLAHATQHQQPRRHASERMLRTGALSRRLWRDRSGIKV